MKVTVRTRSEDEIEQYDYRLALEIQLENNLGEKKKIRFHDGKPEDNCLSRNFSNAFSIPDLLEMAFFAGKNNEEFTVTNITDNDI